jgi:hypothetical protein
MDLEFVLCVIGMVLIVEGLPYFIAPNHIRKWLLELTHLPEGTMRVFGFLAMLTGLVLVYFGRK